MTSTAQNIALKGLSTSISAIANVLFSILLVRHFGTDSYGNLAVALGILMFLSVVADYGLTGTIPAKLPEYEVQALWSSVILPTIGFRIILCVVLWGFSWFMLIPYLDNLYRDPVISASLRFGVVAYIISYGLYTLTTSVFQGLQEWLYELASVTTNSLIILVLLIFIIQGQIGEIEWAILVRAVGFVTGAALIVVYLAQNRHIRYQYLNVPSLRTYFTLISFATPLFFSSVFFAGLTWFDQSYLRLHVNATSVALYNIPLVLVDFLMLALLPLRSVLLPEMSAQFADDNIQDPKTELRKLLILFAGVANLLAGVAILASPLIWVVYGSSFAASIPYFISLIPSFVLRAVTIPLTIYFLTYFDQSRVLMLTQGIALLINVSLNVFMVPIIGVWGSIIAMNLTHLAATSIYVYFSQQAGIAVDKNTIQTIVVFSTPLFLLATLSNILTITLNAFAGLLIVVWMLIRIWIGYGQKIGPLVQDKYRAFLIAASK